MVLKMMGVSEEDHPFFTNASEAEFMQYRWCVGGGPSSKTCPRWAPHRAQRTSVRVMPNETSFFSSTLCSETGCQNEGQPVPDSNFVSERKRSVPQQAHR